MCSAMMCLVCVTVNLESQDLLVTDVQISTTAFKTLVAGKYNTASKHLVVAVLAC